MEDAPSYALNGKIMLCSVIILFLVVLIMVCFHSYSRCCYDTDDRSHRRRARTRSSRHPSYYPFTTNVTTSAEALDPSILKALPTFTYSSKSHDSPLDCAVCLSEFEDEDKGRVLPKCQHTFHVECIDTWFQSVSNCPLCRDPLQADISMLKPDISAERENSPASPATEPAQLERCYPGFSQPPNPGPSDFHGKPFDLVGVVVEVPRL
ncbi:RING-H2 finger protein ATL5-like [Juglans regia]|uniref:RING-type E3 ubiquitin transferase n=1 Tax=Juglans regia TaxID=51240 RepID=A0A2I4EF15_JUGRE|nr:RING-H2 finger protein ATL5-like [Juglans regia]